MPAQIVSCSECGGTGEQYIPALAGDGWTGGDCEACGGFGRYLQMGGGSYLLALTPTGGLVYRDAHGHFAPVPQEALAVEER
jgi:hypothetical protein